MTGQLPPSLSSQGQLVGTPLLDSLASPRDVAGLTSEQLQQLADELRQRIIATVSCNGGHLAPSLGVVELTIALLSSFDAGRDKVIWDVGHQAYAWKLLTGRAASFHTLRRGGGISGFPKMTESPYDHFGVGHSSTSISAALGMAMARDLAGGDSNVVAVIGDGSMTAGLAFEGLNQAGAMDRKLIVVLNDNEMSISKNVGALSLFLSRNLSKRWVRRMKKDMETFMRSIPGIGEDMLGYAKRSEHSLKGFFTPGMLFEAFGFNYIGPVNGHDVKALTRTFDMARTLDEPVLLHVLTRKGKGYAPAETNPTHFHGVGRFEPETGRAAKLADAPALPSFTDVFGETLCMLADEDKRVIAITAAMPEGTGTSCFCTRHPERFVDVGICEQHAVTFAAGLATQGLRPFVAIYSTFLQRSYDQVVHDVCIQNLPVVFCVDRAGLVGEDGPTHHGVFDLSYLRHIPNMHILAPRDEAQLRHAMRTALALNAPVAIRYPRGVGTGAALPPRGEVQPLGRGEVLKQGRGVAVIACGSRVAPALEAAERVAEESGRQVTVFDAVWVKPLPEAQLLELAATHDALLLLEENALAGGFTSAVLECLADHGALRGQAIRRLGVPDHFVEHGSQKELRAKLGLCVDGIEEALRSMLGLE